MWMIVGPARRSLPAFLFVLAAIAAPSHAAAQAAQSPDPPPAPLTLDAALQYALDHYPSVRAAIEGVSAADADVRVAQSAYLPRLDAVWQTSRATANNVFGQVLPQSVIPAMSGPVLASASAGSVWGSAAGALFSWEAFDFGLRAAAVREAQAGVDRATADQAVAQLSVQGAVGAAFLTIVTADEALAAANADVERREVLARAAHVLADNQLRAGAEVSRADAERAAAQTRAIQARQAAAIARSTLARLLGVSAAVIQVSADNLRGGPDRPRQNEEAEGRQYTSATHPIARLGQAAVDFSRAREAVLDRTDRPRLLLQSALFARGTGANPDGRLDGGANGLGLERANWATGVQLVFPNLLDSSNLKARRAAAAARTRAEQARYEEAVLTVSAQRQVADATLEAATAIAQNTPIQLAAAQQSETQARARYEAGLTSITEVAESQNLLAQAEYQDAVARVDVWRALLAQAVARGDLAPFLRRVRTPGVQ